MESPLIAAAHTIGAEFPDAAVPAHYGDPYAEQRALVQAAGFVDRSNRDVVTITGADRLSWLNSISTQKVDDLPPGVAVQTLILSPHGHVEHHLFVLDDGATTWIHVEPGEAKSLIEFLDSMRFMLRVRCAEVTDHYAVVTVMGPQAPADVAQSAAVAMDFGFGIDLLVERARLADVAADLQAAGLRPAGIWAHEALRIAGHRPRFGTDTDHKTIPHEVGWIGSVVHLNKGCYRGQETVARVHNLGHPPRRLVLLNLDGSEDRLPAHGEQVFRDEAIRDEAIPDQIIRDGIIRDENFPSRTSVGFVGSAARHFEFGPIALALVKRNLPVHATLRAAGLSAAQEVIVPPDAGANVKIKLPRRRDDR